jgi:hypothetical protein
MSYLQTLISDEESLSREFGDQTSHAILAIDPGIKSTATAVVIDSILPERSWNLSFSKGCHQWNSHRHATKLNQQKKVKQFMTTEGRMSINDIQAKIKPVDSGNPKDVGLGDQLEILKQSYQQHLVSVLSVEDHLRSFYGSDKSKVERYRKEQGEKSEVGKAISGMLSAVRSRAKINSRRPMVVIGDGDFKGRKGVGVKSSKFISTLKSQVL